MAVGDFAHDGKVEIAVCNSQQGFGVVTVLLGKGDGTFGAPANYNVGLGDPLCVTVGDFNGDGNADLALGTDHGAVEVLLGKGDGTFGPATAFASGGPTVTCLAAADFTRAGKLDLVTSENTLLLGNGDGTFQAPRALGIGTGSWASVAVADFNGDGIPDLAVGNPNAVGIDIALGNGDGTFRLLGPPGRVTLAISAPYVLAGDFNGDGKPDLAVASDNPTSQTAPGSVVVLLGKGDGTFGAPTAYPDGIGPVRLAAGDFNGDGKPDLVVADLGNPITGVPGPTLQELQGNGDGTFQETPAFDLPGGPGGGPVAADFNGDGRSDLAVTGGVIGGSAVRVFLAQALPASTPLVVTGAGYGGGPQVNVYDAATGHLEWSFMAYDPRFLGGVRVALGDVNGDGTLDVITAPGPSGGPDIRVFDGKTGALVWEFMAFDPHFLGGAYVAAGDLPGDAVTGFADIVVGADAGGGPHVKVFSGASHKEFASFYAYDPAFRGGVRIAIGDVNGDGKNDVITGAGPGGGPHVKVFDGATIGSNAPTVLASFCAYSSSFTGGVFVAAGDTENDGQAEIITGAGAGGTPQVRVFADDGSLLQSFEAYSTSFRGGVQVGAITDVDGNADIVTGAGPSGGPHVKVFDGANLAVLDSFYAYNPTFPGGVYVGGS
jgi:hypothetical protein